MVVSKSWKQRLCNTFNVKSQIPRVCWLSVLYILAYFSRTPSWSVFVVVLGVFRCHFWFIFGAKGCSRSGFGDFEKMMQKKRGTIWGILAMVGGWGVPYNNPWSVAVLGHGASWSLVVEKGQVGPAGNWSRPALEARWWIIVIIILIITISIRLLSPSLISSRLLLLLLSFMIRS